MTTMDERNLNSDRAEGAVRMDLSKNPRQSNPPTDVNALIDIQADGAIPLLVKYMSSTTRRRAPSSSTASCTPR